MEQQAQQIQPRQIAYVIEIKDLLSGIFIKEDGWIPNYIKVGSKNVSRVNIIGVITDNKEANNVQTLIIDDGTGSIIARNFEKKSDVNVGDVVLLVGRVRQYGNERYITPEIIKKNVDARWKRVWEKNVVKGDSNSVKVDAIEDEARESPKADGNYDKIISKIRELDDGSGASYEEIIKIFKDKERISNLLLHGDVFEVKPGRLKVLE